MSNAFFVSLPNVDNHTVLNSGRIFTSSSFLVSPLDERAVTPVPSFTYTKDHGTVSFTDTSTNTPTQWLWDFGDRYTSTLENPTHTYEMTGPYYVALTAGNADGSEVYSEMIIIAAPI